MRAVRAVVGILLLVLALPMLIAGGALWTAMQHRDPTGAFVAPVAEIAAEGHALVVPDVDALLGREAPFARAGRTTLKITAQTDAGPAFIALARAEDAARYLAGVPYATIDGVRITRGRLPADITPVPGTRAPATTPARQTFWLPAGQGGRGDLTWTPAAVRDQDLSLVVMNPDARGPMTVDLTVELTPSWLNQATWAALVLGTILLLGAAAAMAWPARTREIVYVVEPSQVTEIAARLGVHPMGEEPRRRGPADPGWLDAAPRRSWPVNTPTWPTVSPPPTRPTLTWPPENQPSTRPATLDREKIPS